MDDLFAITDLLIQPSMHEQLETARRSRANMETFLRTVKHGLGGLRITWLVRACCDGGLITGGGIDGAGLVDTPLPLTPTQRGYDIISSVARDMQVGRHSDKALVAMATAVVGRLRFHLGRTLYRIAVRLSADEDAAVKKDPSLGSLLGVRHVLLQLRLQYDPTLIGPLVSDKIEHRLCDADVLNSKAKGIHSSGRRRRGERSLTALAPERAPLLYLTVPLQSGELLRAVRALDAEALLDEEQVLRRVDELEKELRCCVH